MIYLSSSEDSINQSINHLTLPLSFFIALRVIISSLSLSLSLSLSAIVSCFLPVPQLHVYEELLLTGNFTAEFRLRGFPDNAISRRIS